MTHAPDAPLDRIRAALQAHLPVQGPRLGLGLSTTPLHKGGPQPDSDDEDLVVRPERGAYATLRLWVWEAAASPGAAPLLESIVEQQVLLAPARALDDPRLEAYLEGWCLALARLFAQPDPPEALIRAMPYDLVAPDALRLARPRLPEDFARALLGAKRRLGAFAGPALAAA